MSLRNLQDRYRYGKNVGAKILNEITGRLKSCGEITKELVSCEKYSGVMVIDGKFVPCKEEIKRTEADFVPRSSKRRKIMKGMVWILFVDYHSHDIPEFVSAKSENIDDFSRGFHQLKLLRYPLKVVTCDKNPRLLTSLFYEFPNVLVQYCLKHYLSEIQRYLKILGYRRSVKSIQKKMENLNYDDCAFIRSWSRKKMVRLANQYLQLEYQYEALNDFYETMIDLLYAKSIKQKNSKRRYLEQVFFKIYFPLERSAKYRSRITKVYLQFLEDEKNLFTHLEHPNLDIPYTTNLNEGYNNQIENRIFSIRGFESPKTCEQYGNALILKRRFKKFTDCKGKFKHLNGKSPLEIAGANTSKIKNWIRFSISKKRPKK